MTDLYRIYSKRFFNDLKWGNRIVFQKCSLTYKFRYIPFQARSPMEAEEGLLFMQEMLELSKTQSQQPDRKPQAVSVPIKDKMGEVQVITLKAGPSQFGVNLIGNQKVQARTAIVEPFHACTELLMPMKILEGKIALIERGECMFVDKVRNVQQHGAVGKQKLFLFA